MIGSCWMTQKLYVWTARKVPTTSARGMKPKLYSFSRMEGGVEMLTCHQPSKIATKEARLIWEVQLTILALLSKPSEYFRMIERTTSSTGPKFISDTVTAQDIKVLNPRRSSTKEHNSSLEVKTSVWLSFSRSTNVFACRLIYIFLDSTFDI
jgi:hypothetical protein